jgi:predicted nucleic-acid-binding Zn-ribbon protein
MTDCKNCGHSGFNHVGLDENKKMQRQGGVTKSEIQSGKGSVFCMVLIGKDKRCGCTHYSPKSTAATTGVVQKST